MVAAFARSDNGGLFVTASGLSVRHRDVIGTLAARHKLPAVYFARHFVAAGGLISYGPDFVDQYRPAAGYKLTGPKARAGWIVPHRMRRARLTGEP